MNSVKFEDEGECWKPSGSSYIPWKKSMRGKREKNYEREAAKKVRGGSGRKSMRWKREKKYENGEKIKAG